jgi:plastocyanin
LNPGNVSAPECIQCVVREPTGAATTEDDDALEGRVTLTQAGEIDYYCRFHPNVVEYISVTP